MGPHRTFVRSPAVYARMSWLVRTRPEEGLELMKKQGNEKNLSFLSSRAAALFIVGTDTRGPVTDEPFFGAQIGRALLKN